MQITQETLDILVSHIRDTSLSRLKILSGREDVVVTEIEAEPLVYAHWMSLVLVSGRTTRITLKSHFSTEAGRFFASWIYKTKEQSISQDRISDFFREYSNMCAGHLKALLAVDQVKVSVSLPALTRGFDEIFYLRSKDTEVRYWSLVCGNEKVDYSVHIEIFDPFILNKGVLTSMEAQGEVDFL